MFELIQTIDSPLRFDIDRSQFDKDYPKESFNTVDPDNSPVESILYYCCGIIDESGFFEFWINCFDRRFKLPIRPELSLLLGQLDKLTMLLSSKSTTSATVEFFEQGYQMAIVFTRSEDHFDVRVDSKIPPSVINGRLSPEELLISVSSLILRFLHAVAVLVPDIMKEPAFEVWFSRLVRTG